MKKVLACLAANLWQNRASVAPLSRTAVRDDEPEGPDRGAARAAFAFPGSAP